MNELDWTIVGRSYQLKNGDGDKIKRIKEQTGWPFWECKKALMNSEGDMDKALELLGTLEP